MGHGFISRGSAMPVDGYYKAFKNSGWDEFFRSQ
jgi:hypothetical protein